MNGISCVSLTKDQKWEGDINMGVRVTHSHDENKKQKNKSTKWGGGMET